MDCETFLAWAEKKGWTVERRTVPLSLPQGVTRRYAFPPEYLDFLERVDRKSVV